MEFVQVSGPARVYAQKNLFHSQLSLLNTVKIYHRYKLLKKEELKLKDLLRKKINELKTEINNFDKLLPKTHHKAEVKQKPKKEVKKRDELEIEIDKIRMKLAELQ